MYIYQQKLHIHSGFYLPIYLGPIFGPIPNGFEAVFSQNVP